ncbi:MAG: alpha/beta hydrolase [Bacteroidota bacterium]
MRASCFLIFAFLGFSCSENEPTKPYHTFDLASPQLGLTKTIWVYLPADYSSSDKRYPVIYSQDGQWLFTEAEGYSAEMHVDEHMRQLEADGFEGAIVVGIGSDEATRGDEFALYESTTLEGGGKGLQYLQFMTQTLKPYIDANYRTKTDRANTMVMGASLGGLAVFFALTEFPDVFSKAAFFSPALHFNGDYVFAKAKKKEVRVDTRVYGIVGKNEFNEIVNFPEDSERLFDALGLYMPAEQLHFQIFDDGEHRIWFWDREFPHAIEFLFGIK